MPIKARTICNAPGCYVVCDGGKCHKHAEEYRIRRRKANTAPGDPFYVGARWKKLRASKLASNPLCERCESFGRTEPARQVHHIEARQDAPDREYDWDNLMAICHPCHRALTIEAAKKRKDG